MNELTDLANLPGQEIESNYHEIDAISNSRLGLIKYAPYKYKDFKETTTDSMIFGSALHSYFLEIKEFEREYTIMDSILPTTDKVKIIQEYATWLFENKKAAVEMDNEVLLNIYYKFYKGTTTKDPYEKRKKDLETAKQIIEENRRYFNNVLDCIIYNKKVLSLEDFNKITYLWFKHSNGNLSSILLPEKGKMILDYELGENIEVLSELPILWTLRDITPNDETIKVLIEQYKIDVDAILKSKLDRVIIDNTNKRVFLIDLKTTSKSIEQFNDSYNFYAYYRQLAFYANALHKYKPELFNISEWEVIICIVPIETTGNLRALVCEVSDEDLAKGTLEFIELLEDLFWHKREDKWEFTRDVYENGLILSVNKSEKENKEDDGRKNN